MLNERRAALTLKVLTALSFRPVKGSVSGPRWQDALRLTRQTWLTKLSMQCPAVSGRLGEHADLLAVVAFGDVVQDFLKVLEFQDGADRPELLFLEQGGVAGHREQNGWENHVALHLTAAVVDHGGPFPELLGCRPAWLPPCPPPGRG